MSETQSGSDDLRSPGRTEHSDRKAAAARATGMQWLELEDKSAQSDGGTIRPAWPQPWARQAGVEHKTDVTPVVHVPTGAVVFLPPELEADEFLASIGEQ